MSAPRPISGRAGGGAARKNIAVPSAVRTWPNRSQPTTRPDRGTERTSMARQLPIEIFMPPNILKAKVGSAIGGIDMAAIKRAEAAVETLKVEFQDWLASDVGALGGCRDAFAAAPS